MKGQKLPDLFEHQLRLKYLSANINQIKGRKSSLESHDIHQKVKLRPMESMKTIGSLHNI